MHSSCAIDKPHSTALHTIISFKCDSYSLQYGGTALLYACLGGHIQTVKLLLTHGDDPNTQNEVSYIIL